MCKNEDDNKGSAPAEAAPAPSNEKNLMYLFAACTVGLLIATIVLAIQKNNAENKNSEAEVRMSNVPNNDFFETETIFSAGKNTCDKAKVVLENVDCVHVAGPQAGGNVTKGYVGGMETDVVPNTNAYWASSMCPVNVHWHLGTEHYSMGEYDEYGDGPHGGVALKEHSDDPSDYDDGKDDYTAGEDDGKHNETDAGNARLRGRRLAGEVRGGFRCRHYDANDEKFTKEYEWKHCKGMEVGETYEVHWPHSAAGACGTINQYQTPFYDGVFCNLPEETFMEIAKEPQNIASAVGVQAQIYTIVNDESYFYPDMIRGWIVDEVDDMAQDIAYYTGSTTGTSRDNELCSQYTPITWQVDRKCHMISASSFDKLCYDMKLQRDDMTEDLHAHGSRELVKDSLVANNQVDRKLKETEHKHDHGHLTAEQERHLRTYGHYHDHDHDHEEWF